MRPDMGKVITERHRTKSVPTAKFGKTIRWNGFDGDYTEPKFQSGSQGRVYGYDRKQPTDVLGPLKGWVEKQVGRPWDKVYSELCQVLDKRKLTHKHVIDHLYQWVGRTVILCKDGCYREPDNISGFWTNEGKWVLNGFAPEYFVHPKTGLLERNKARESKQERAERFRKDAKSKKLIEVGGGSVFKKIADIWYRLDVRIATSTEVTLYLDHENENSRVFSLGQKTYYVQAKRQLGKRELREIRQRLA